MYELLLNNKDLSIGLLASLAVGMGCLYTGLEVLSIGAFLAAGLYITKLYLRHKGPEQKAPDSSAGAGEHPVAL
ncbi:MAG: hypothetical protein OEV92_09175 [Nitrospinota bacterium]|nr:hypothetical protein [Nitrospinota bacterium]